MSFPTQEEELALHERVLKRDPVAPTDVFQVFMDPILSALGRKEGREREDAYDSIIDVLFSYLANPERYLSQKGRLSTYLTQAAKKRLLDRYRSTEARQRREQEFGDAFELGARSPNDALEISVEARRAVVRLEQSALGEGDRALLGLVLQGERSTLVMAEAIGLASLPEDDRRREVKRHRDRLMKWLARLGKEDSDDES
ncbi:sigma-70 family RNA polymerase sigma factor [Pyxidicoccus fallax]|uniref:Sigma-70 family RNA polymerase sigma factor n=1 Tax=Pyxidicoccus fallax TaxID=394095 RepID=A0A848LI84_9BACT|nr:sigma-70 family RNA polymerase sigma factor [Pyxidicoccus fallax]NMO17427.1 sigma-70 family RNA polymerase sigma factor [Pyxidicoccus fallax]NPC77976.1 sigma-70 family RNA polymerase sigma factor [Pyxidicoccus fallax]